MLVNSIAELMASASAVYKHHSKIKHQKPTSSQDVVLSQVKRAFSEKFSLCYMLRDLPFFLKLAPPGGLVIYSLNKLFMNIKDTAAQRLAGAL